MNITSRRLLKLEAEKKIREQEIKNKVVLNKNSSKLKVVETITKSTDKLTIDEEDSQDEDEDYGDEDEDDEDDDGFNCKPKLPIGNNKNKKVLNDDSNDDYEKEEEEEENIKVEVKSSTKKPTTTSKPLKTKPIIKDDQDEEENEEEYIKEKYVNKTSIKTSRKSNDSVDTDTDKEEQEEEEDEEEETFKPKRLGKAATKVSSLKKPQPPKSKKTLESEEEESENNDYDDDLYQQESSSSSENDDNHDHYAPPKRRTNKKITTTKTTTASSKFKNQFVKGFDLSDNESNEEEEEEDNSYDISKLVDQLNGFVKHEEKHIYINSKKSDNKKYFTMKQSVYDGLFWYQRDGVNWLWNLFCRHAGGILGDDMGLGKTMQICSFLNSMHSQGHIKHTLLVMPVALIEHWCKEFDRFKPTYLVKIFHGNKAAERRQSLKMVQERGGIIITTYGMVVSNVADMKTYNCKAFSWDYIILDEGHKIKETKTQISKAMREFTAKHKIIMTGTAIQNNLRELWALFDWVCDGTLLGTARQFSESFSGPIVKSHTTDASQNARIFGSALAENLRNIIAPHFLRREKKDVFKPQSDNVDNDDEQDDGEQNEEEVQNEEDGASDSDGGSGEKKSKLLEMKLSPTKKNSNRLLTPRKLVKKRMSMINGGIKTRKNDFVIWTKLTDSQIELYRIFLESDEVKEALNKTKSPLAALTVLKKICDHPHLLREEMKMITINEMKELLSKIGGDRSIKSLVANSGKFQLLLKLLPNLHIEGHRCLMFSQSVKMLDDFEIILEHLDLKFLRIDGSISSTKRRQEIIDTYNNDHSYFAFIMTIQVGALGLNLTSADRVLILDPSWNTIDNQAVDRAYRIGQKKDVVVYRLMSCGTIEEKIYRKQVFKGSLMKTMLDNQSQSSKGQHRYFTSNDLKDLFTLNDPEDSVTQKQLEALHSMNRKTSKELDQHLEFLTGLNMVFGISDHDLLFSESVTTDHSEQDLQMVKDSHQLSGSGRPNKKKAITYQRNTPNKTQVRGRQYVTISDDYGHEEEDLVLVDDLFPDFGENPYNFNAINSTMSPAPKPVKTHLGDIGLGSKRKGYSIEIVDDEHSLQPQTTTTATTTTSTSKKDPIVINLDEDDDDDSDSDSDSDGNGDDRQSVENPITASNIKKVKPSENDSIETIRKIQHFNYLINSAIKYESDNKVQSLHLILDAEVFARENDLTGALTNNDDFFKQIVKQQTKQIKIPSK